MGRVLPFACLPPRCRRAGGTKDGHGRSKHSEPLRTGDATALERFLLRQPGVHHAEVNLVSGALTVHYDDSRLSRQAAVEQGSEHPLAEAISKRARETGIELPPAKEFEAVPGQGARARVEGHEVLVGNLKLLE